MVRRGHVEEVREKIVKAAMKVFAAQGYFRAPAGMIAREAGVSKGLLFWYFRTKDELILEVATRSLPVDVLDACLSRGLKGREALECVGEKFMEKYSSDVMRGLLIQTMAARDVYPQIREAFEKVCLDYIARLAEAAFGGRGQAGRVRARAFLGALVCYVLGPPPDTPWRDYLRHLIDSLLTPRAG